MKRIIDCVRNSQHDVVDIEKFLIFRERYEVYCFGENFTGMNFKSELFNVDMYHPCVLINLIKPPLPPSVEADFQEYQKSLS